MKDNYVKIQLTSINKLTVLCFSSLQRQENLTFTLFKDDEIGRKLKVIRSSSQNLISIFELDLGEDFKFGHQYSVAMSSNVRLPVDVSNATEFPEFDSLFNYNGDDLGCTYTSEEVKFALWAPLASSVILKIFEKDKFVYYPMERGEKGVYRISLKGNYENALYRYIVTNSGVSCESCDPYARACNANSLYSAVIDLSKVKEVGEVNFEDTTKYLVDNIIYEVGIRDFTEQNSDSTNIKNRGKYLGFVEKNRKTKGGHPAGLDYLVDLGVTAVQLNPVIDFGSVNDLNIEEKYNWGYDPISMFCLEGSYSLEPDNPITRLIEFKKMVNELHKANIKVIIDVVYNHIYEYLSSCYEKIVPNYYFRRSKNGHIANASGCGNDFASEKFMVRKMIVDSIVYFVDLFDVDGYRFDLMGLIDIDTIKSAYENANAIKSNVIFYGEGWNMGNELPYEKKACSDNARQIPFAGFFNETVRDIIKGPTFDLSVKGYACGDITYSFGFKYVLCGSCCDVSYEPKFIDANQSINYIECHDNHTMYDKFKKCMPNASEEEIFERVKLANGMLLTCIGVPFVHMGQEIGLSKKGHGNTYNELKVNMMDWPLIDARYDMVTFFKGLVRLRKELNAYHLYKPEDIVNSIHIIEDDGLFVYSFTNPECVKPFKDIAIFYNPTDSNKSFEFEEDWAILVDHCGYHEKDNQILVRNYIVPPTSFSCLIKK